MIISIFLIASILLPSSLEIQIESGDEKTPFNLLDALYFFRATKLKSIWISDSEFLFFVPSSQNILIYDAYWGSTKVLIDHRKLPKTNVSKIKLSSDRRYALISYNRQQVYRYSSIAQYFIYSVEDHWYIHLANASFVQVADWAPVGNSLAYVKDNDLYYVPFLGKWGMRVIQVTNTGVPGVIFNGVADWVYEEETLETDKAFSFSPTGDAIIFATFNDSNVPLYQFLYYGEPGEQYPKIKSVRYPKVGKSNPEVSLYYFSTQTFATARSLTFPTFRQSRSRDIFLGQVFVNNDLIVTGMANRVQNHSWFSICHVQTLESCYTIYEHKNHNGWADLKLPLVSRKADKYLRIVAQPYVKSDININRDFPHLAMFPTREGCTNCGTPIFLTQGPYAVIRVIAWDQDSQVIYFEATAENEPATRHVYLIHEGGYGHYCFSCDIISPEGRPCGYAHASFSSQFTYVILTCDGPDPPITYLYKNTNPLGSPVILEDNQNLRLRLQQKSLPDQLDIRVQVPGPFQAEVRLLLPPNFDSSGKTKYPLVNHVYGGPQSKLIKNDYEIDYSTYLVTNRNVIVALVDPRGADRKELEMMYAVYRKIGTVEVEDQISVTRYLQKRFPFIDPQRTGIWGWSYGGYVTIKALEFDNHNVFKCGIAVAPAVDFLYYDTIYTERYMGLPTEDDNILGYYKANTYKYVNLSNLNTKQLYLIHGSADDNVHYQQSMIFSKILQRNNILFQQQSYPDENHHLGRVTQHLYLSMSAFWNRCFNLTN